MTETCSFHTHLGAPEMYGEPRLGRGAVPVSVSSPIMHTAGWDSREPPHPPPNTPLSHLPLQAKLGSSPYRGTGRPHTGQG